MNFVPATDSGRVLQILVWICYEEPLQPSCLGKIDKNFRHRAKIARKVKNSNENAPFLRVGRGGKKKSCLCISMIVMSLLMHIHDCFA